MDRSGTINRFGIRLDEKGDLKESC